MQSGKTSDTAVWAKLKHEPLHILSLRFFRGLTEYAFKITGWCVLLAGIKFLSLKPGHGNLIYLYWTLLGLMFNFFSVFFIDVFELYLRPKIPPKTLLPGFRIFGSLIISSFLLYSLMFLVSGLVAAFGAMKFSG